MPCHQPCWDVAGNMDRLAGMARFYTSRVNCRVSALFRGTVPGLVRDGSTPRVWNYSPTGRGLPVPSGPSRSGAATRSWSCSKSPLGAVILVGCPYAEETGRETHRPEQVLSTCPATVMPYLQSVNDAVTGAVGHSDQPNQECDRRSCASSSRTLASRAARASRSVLSATSASLARTSASSARAT